MKLKVAIIFGGKSTEHEISLQSATNIFNAIDTSLYEPLLLGVNKSGIWQYHLQYPNHNIDLASMYYFDRAQDVLLIKENHKVNICRKSNLEVLADFDVAFPIIHGAFGEDGTLQGVLKALEIPFVGPDILATSVCMDKDITKRLLRDSSIPIAGYFSMYKHSRNEYTFQQISSTLGLPLFIKPANAGSSVGVSKVSDEASFDMAVENAFQYDNKILIEEAIICKEIECAVLGNENPEVSVLGEIITTNDFYSYDAKYISSDIATLIIPATIDKDVSDRMRECAKQAFKAVGCEGMARIDFFLKDDQSFVLNEINTHPGFTKISMYPQMWEKTGISYKDLITRLIELAIERDQRDSTLLKSI